MLCFNIDTTLPTCWAPSVSSDVFGPTLGVAGGCITMSKTSGLQPAVPSAVRWTSKTFGGDSWIYDICMYLNIYLWVYKYRYIYICIYHIILYIYTYYNIHTHTWIQFMAIWANYSDLTVTENSWCTGESAL